MKNLFKFNSLLLAAFTLLAVSCNNGGDDPEPDPGTSKPSPITLTVSGATSIEAVTANVSYSVSEIAKPYFVGVTTKANFNAVSLTDDAAVLALAKTLAPTANLATVDNKYVFSGDKTVKLSPTWAIAENTEYVVFAVGFDATGAVLTKVSSAAFTVVPSDEFTLDINIVERSSLSVGFTATPSDQGQGYVITVIEKAEYESATPVQNAESWISYLQSQGALTQATYSGTLENTSFGYLAPEEEYVIFACAVNGSTIASDIIETTITTTAYSDQVITVEVDGILDAEGEVPVVVTVTDKDAPFYFGFWATASLAGLANDLAILNTIPMQESYNTSIVSGGGTINLTGSKAGEQITALAFAVTEMLYLPDSELVRKDFTVSQVPVAAPSKASAIDSPSRGVQLELVPVQKDYRLVIR